MLQVSHKTLHMLSIASGFLPRTNALHKHLLLGCCSLNEVWADKHYPHWQNLPTRFRTHSMNLSASSSGSTESVHANVGEDSAVVSKTVRSNRADSCTWYANASCKRPRTCYDCLNVKVASGECAIMPNGMCVSLAEYSHFLSKQQEFGIYFKYYPSSNYTYCSADDSACSVCASNWVSNSNSSGSIVTPAYCTGLNGCICLAYCELPDWSDSIVTDQCSTGGSSVVNIQTSKASRIGVALVVGIAFGLFLGLWCIMLLLRRQSFSRGRESSIPAVRETWTVPRPPRAGPQLALTGWKELREKLIAIEQEAFGTEVTILESHARSENSDAAMEEGSAYHPASPNQRRPRDEVRLD